MKLDYLTHEELTALDYNKCTLVIPAGPYEQHGPHLPVSTDIIIARYLAESLCEAVKNEIGPGAAVEAPAFVYAPALISDGIGRTPQFTPEAFTAFFSETLKQYCATGFKNIIIVIHHFELKFVKCVINAIAACESEYREAKIIEPLSAYYYSGEYNTSIEKHIASKKNSNDRQDDIIKCYADIDFKTEIHACIKETSLMMYLLPRAVKSDVLLTLKPFLVNPASEFFKLNFTFKKMGAESGYIGSPARASIFLGELIFKQLRSALSSAVNASLCESAPPYSIPLFLKAVLTVI